METSMGESDPRIPLDGLPTVLAEVEALLDDPERLKRLREQRDGQRGIPRKTIERMRREGLPKQLRLFLLDKNMARALLAEAERLQAA